MGTGGSCSGWLPLQVPEFSKERRTLIFDYPGVRESEPYPKDGFSTADLADTLAGLLDALEIGAADVMGVFMGGMVAQELALRHPEHVRRLVLVGTCARPDAKLSLLLEHWRDLLRIEAPLEVLVRDRLLWTLQDDTLEQRDLIQSMVDYYASEGPALSHAVFRQQCEATLAHDTLDRLRHLTCRTLVACGRRDRITPPDFHRQLADEIPDAHLVTFAYGAHLVMVESAERFNETVLEFLRDE
jgi:pimeloyl-ACP methyl ester carboxylesterase